LRIGMPPRERGKKWGNRRVEDTLVRTSVGREKGDFLRSGIRLRFLMRKDNRENLSATGSESRKEKKGCECLAFPDNTRGTT